MQKIIFYTNGLESPMFGEAVDNTSLAINATVDEVI
jgi:hypothetical protein